VEIFPHLIDIGIYVMKKSRIVIAAIIVSLSLLSSTSSAGPTEKTPPTLMKSASETQSTSEWFFSFFGNWSIK
jgi:hypothetical protein